MRSSDKSLQTKSSFQRVSGKLGLGISCFLLTAFGLVNNAEAADPFYVYSDKFDHGFPSGIMGAKNGSSIKSDPKNTEGPAKGEFCWKISVDGSESWAGVFVQAKGGWKKKEEKGYTNLSEYKYLVFSAKSNKDYTIAKLGMGEGGEVTKEEGKIPLTKEWKRYVLELPETGDKTNVNGLFLAVFEGEGTVYLDEIFYADKNFVPAAGDVVSGERKEPLDADAFYVYSDKLINGIPSGFMGSNNGSSLKLDPDWKENPYQGPKCIQIKVGKGETWRGIHLLYTGKWKAQLSGKEELANLSKYKKLVFYARTDEGELSIPEIGVGTGDEGEEKAADTFIELGPKWQKYTISLSGSDLSKVNSVLYMVLPEGTLYLDEIRFVK